ncbi:universal stress protein [Pedobacter sp. P351]|uniref:universal stress protein n=1 Tax=Pedobacter superstes TaxID=3133441 RepID=UPI0030B443DE
MKTILVLTDFSARADHAAQYAMQIASKAKAKILLYNSFFVPQVIPAVTTIYPYYEDYAVIEKENLLQLKKKAEGLKKKFSEENAGAPPEIQIKNDPGNIAENVHELAKLKKFWMIIMGDKSQEGTFSRFIFGSDTHTLIEEAVCPVLLIPEKIKPKPLKKIAYATDLEQSEHKSMSFLKELSDIWGSEILVIHVLSNDLTAEEKVRNYDSYKQIISRIKFLKISYTDVRSDDIAMALEKFTKKETVDILAILHKKRSFIGKVLHKSISKEMLNYHHVPILVLP